jgi:hypothetical protein
MPVAGVKRVNSWPEATSDMHLSPPVSHAAGRWAGLASAKMLQCQAEIKALLRERQRLEQGRGAHSQIRTTHIDLHCYVGFAHQCHVRPRKAKHSLARRQAGYGRSSAALRSDQLAPDGLAQLQTLPIRCWSRFAHFGSVHLYRRRLACRRWLSSQSDLTEDDSLSTATAGRLPGTVQRRVRQILKPEGETT